MKRARTWIAVAVALAPVGPGVGCSVLLQEESLPCTTDADCVKYSGSHCDLQGKQCVAGDPMEGGSATHETGVASTVDAADSRVVEATADAPPDSAADASADVDSPVADAREGGDAEAAAPTEPDWTALQRYLDSLYDPTQSLFRSFPGSNEYRTSNDNALALKALAYLPQPEDAKIAAITARLAELELCGCADHPGHSAALNHFIDPLVLKGATISTTPATVCTLVPFDTSVGATCTHSVPPPDAGPVCPAARILHDDHPTSGVTFDSCNAQCSTSTNTTWSQPMRGMGDAKVIALEILSYRNQGASTSAVDALWQNLLGKWDSLGIADGQLGSPPQYSVDALALFKVVARLLGHALPDGVDALLAAAQLPNGGIGTRYNAMGVLVDRLGSTQTAALVVLAYRMPVTDL
jgi:hypothetical protein